MMTRVGHVFFHDDDDPLDMITDLSDDTYLRIVTHK